MRISEASIWLGQDFLPLGFVFLGVLVRYGAEYMTVNMKTVYVSTQISRGWVYLALPVGAVIMGLSLLLHSVEAWYERDEALHRAGGPPMRDV